MFRRILNIFFITMAVGVLWSQSVCAAIYSCYGRDGTIHYTNTPASPHCQVMNLKKRNDSRYYSSKRNRSYSSSAYDGYIRKIASRYKVDRHLIKAVIKAESGFNRYAVSKKGAQGLMQLMPATAKTLRVGDPFDPRQNIDGGTRYLKKLLDTFEGNVSLSLAAYNAGPTRVKRHNKIPNIPETIRYVQKVLRNYRKYKNS